MMPVNHYLSGVDMQIQLTESLISVYTEVQGASGDVQRALCFENVNFKNSSSTPINCNKRLQAEYVVIEAPVNFYMMCGDIVLYGGGK